MSEKRIPDAVIRVQAGGQNRKFELYLAEQFKERCKTQDFFHAEHPQLRLTALDFDNAVFVRVRCDGVWLPVGQRAMFPMHRATFLITQEVNKLITQGDPE